MDIAAWAAGDGRTDISAATVIPQAKPMIATPIRRVRR
jgi:hypothetical protein